VRGTTVRLLRRLAPASRRHWRAVKRAYTRLSPADRLALRAQIEEQRRA
jgi:hypothetical protein